MEPENFGSAMHLAGLRYDGPLLADGKLHRFKAGSDHARNSWYVLHPGPPAAGVFGCWKRGIKETWCEERRAALTDLEWRSIHETWKRAEAERERVEKDYREKARKTAAWILAKAGPPDGNGYLAGKDVKPYGQLRQWRGSLVVPLRDAAGELHTLQFIGRDGTKRFLSGGHVAGCFFTAADKPDGAVLVAEGYATAASVHEATGFATVAAMDCANLLGVAKALREKFPQREIILAADHDQWTDGNPGLTKATEAANTVHAKLAAPRFKDTASKPTDFNDLHQLEGLNTVKEQIENAGVPKETDEQTYERLAKLSPGDYDRCRDDEAKRLGIRIRTLDTEIDRRRPETDTKRATQGSAVELPSVQPWPEHVDGAEVLDAVATASSRYLVLPPGAADVFALWVAQAHAFEAFPHTPRLNLYSPEKGCGKTTALDVLASVTPRPLRTENLTAAVLFRLVDAHKPTLLLDEVDSYLNDAEELRGLLNAGHKQGARAYRCEGDSNAVRGFNAFAPAALAGIGALPGTLHDRSIIVRLVRARLGEVAARFDSRQTAYETELCRKLARWAADNFAGLEVCDPKLPNAAFNRLADNWRPLFAIAELAGGGWPQRAAEAFAKLTTGDDLDAQGIGTMLLADIAAVFSAAGFEKLPSARLAGALAEFEGRPWAEFGKHRTPISVNQLANQLRRFCITPRTVRTGDETAKGYALRDFSEAFERYLPNAPVPDRHSVTCPEIIGDSHVSEPSHPESVLHPGKATFANTGAGCDGVTVQKPGEAGKESELAQADLI